MRPLLEKLIEALREELQQYGEMLARLERQQQCVLSRGRGAADELLHCVAEVESQGAVIRAARERREACQQALAEHLQTGAAAELGRIIPLLPPDYRPLLQALVEEINECLARVRQRARQNHLLLMRSVELMQRLLGTVLPPADAATYDQSGQLIGGAGRRPLPAGPLYEAVG
jgi:flagellar biosynthesis/type III secretory pathway chaperone